MKKEMTQEQALELARKLWGAKAGVRDNGRAIRFSKRCWGQYQVGSGTYAVNDGKGKVCIWGIGFTWQTAFDDARTRYKYWELKQA